MARFDPYKNFKFRVGRWFSAPAAEPDRSPGDGTAARRNLDSGFLRRLRFLNLFRRDR